MQQKLETIKGWDIDTSFESQGILKPKNNSVIAEEPCQTKTLSSERKPSPKKINKTPKTRTPINSVHCEQGSLSSNSLGKLYVKKQFKQPLPPPQLLTIDCSPTITYNPSKAYSSAQLNTILQLKRKNMYLQSILKKQKQICLKILKVNNNESDERYNKSQSDQLMVTHNRASQSMWMESTMAMRSFFNTRIGHFKANGTKHKFAVFLIYGKEGKGKPNPLGEVSRDYTINLHKAVHKETFKRKAPRAVSHIVRFAQKNMLTEDVRIDPQLNEAVWARGIRNLPRRIRVRLQRKKKEEDDGKGKYYTLAQYVPVDSFDNLKTEITKQQ